MSRYRLLAVLCAWGGCENAADSKMVVERYQAATKEYCACDSDACRTKVESELDAWKATHAQKIESMGREATMADVDEKRARAKCLAEAPLDVSTPADPVANDEIASPELKDLAKDLEELQQGQKQLENDLQLAEQLDEAERAKLDAERDALEAKMGEATTP